MGYFSIAKGFAMFLILYGHSMTIFYGKSYKQDQISASFKAFWGAGQVLGGGIMAMFFLISGYGFYKRSIKKTWKNQTGLLLRPYYITALLVLLSKLILAVIERRSFMENGGQYILTYLLGLNAEGGGKIFGIPIESVSIFWFILGLFGGWMIYTVIINQVKEEKRQLFFSLIISFIGTLLAMWQRVWPFCFPIMCITTGYLALGVYIREHGLLERSLKARELILLTVIPLICLAFGRVDMVNGIWRLGPLDFIGSACIGFFLLKAYVWLMGFDGFKNNRLSAFLTDFGFYSMWVVCIHAYEKVVIPWHWLKFFLADYPALCAILVLILRTIFIVISYKFIIRFEKRRRKRKKGKRRKITLEDA